mmetsp:Transcript_20200/g.34752  ORF Transcript_20200/g.34752 Transcript_20200/m.34752 type:complete len:232 (-) Transcript_20200:584-1279(-)|eukprot:CAMPEP_0119109556 /NCGR_PEP_ID=MMETSP1180-20130426/20346_1 /TAXON_ID=3052 ORGANISM="Chlamydomonas cf sp, Strain CCMP681" /NCGR_SAMPLE_ID=MMETSP1180 /ASSEMBLY_ACC=CAM_ASM_000741 /LENGTH=231 /DNA_ID=CAMNT_0007095381 /DNA_START=102 /DNA_END=797 /DNA_ORIENTATION=+
MALNWVSGQLSKTRAGVSHAGLADIAHRDVNIVHIRRPNFLADRHALQQNVNRSSMYRAQAVVLPQDPEPSMQRLVSGLQLSTAAHALLVSDMSEQAQSFAQAVSGVADCTRLNVKLEVLDSTTCPRWHADHVTARLLCTYVGPGTLFLPNMIARRGWSWPPGSEVTVQAEQPEQDAVQACEGDLLLLKGHSWPGFYGLGAVHRSPDVGEQLRLLLTIDDALVEHGPACAC